MNIAKTIVGVFLLCVSSVSSAALAKTEQQFAKEMAERLIKQMPEISITQQKSDPLELIVAGGEWQNGKINLHRIWGFCEQATAKDCKTVKQEFVKKISTPQPKSQLKDLRIIVRDQEYLDFVLSIETKSNLDKPVAFVRKQIGNDLHAFLAIVSPETTSIVSDTVLKDDFGLDAEQAWALAFEQMTAALPPLPTAAQIAQKVVIFENSQYLVSLLIDLKKWSKIAESVGPNLFVSVTSDQFVLVGEMPDGQRMSDFKKSVVKFCGQQERCVSPHVYRFRDEQWLAIP